jgi:GTP cyclohydrolase I
MVLDVNPEKVRQNGHATHSEAPHKDKKVDYPKLLELGRELLIAIGEDPDREGLLDTPRRWADSWREFIEYDPGKTETTFTSASTDQMVCVSGMRVWSLCIPGKQLVNAVDGVKPAREVCIGDKLWTLHNGEVRETVVTDISSHQTRDVVEVVTARGTFKVTSDHPLATPHGWMEAKDVSGQKIEWTDPRSLCRERYVPKLGYHFGYANGAMCSDGTVGDRYISLVVNEKPFAQVFAQSLEGAFGINAVLEAVSRPSGYLRVQLPGYRVRVVSSYLADLFRQYVGGDAHHMRQQFPLVVLNSQETFQGFLDGYIEGDGCRRKNRNASMIISANVPFLQSVAALVGARFTPDKRGGASKVYISDSWYEKHGFQQQDHRTTLHESEWVDVLSVRSCANTRKPYTVYSFTCDPYPTFLVGGHLTHNCEHHLLPFYCDVAIGYIAEGKVLGLSKFARIAHQFAHQLQLQERLGQQIADEVSRITGTNDVAVVLKGRHLCMESRGIQTPAVMSSSVMRGAFRDQFETRMEFLRMIED